MIEFKDYIFKEELITKPSAAGIKNYIDEKFVRASDGKNKGISQLSNQIKALILGKFVFDQALTEMLTDGQPLFIYPVLCYTDFMFSMPGINKYVNQKFEILTSDMQSSNIIVKPVTMMTIAKLFDYSLTTATVLNFSQLLDLYWYTTREEEQNIQDLDKGGLKMTSGFDEVYEAKNFQIILNTQRDVRQLYTLLDLIGFNDPSIHENL